MILDIMEVKTANYEVQDKFYIIILRTRSIDNNLFILFFKSNNQKNSITTLKMKLNFLLYIFTVTYKKFARIIIDFLYLTGQ